ncbi:MAG: hypothetical protein NTU49_01785, partial [Gammaproteobacteria bacterium]|nr:hypothetical protein [Gammaproteobacteria bacterium]
MRHKYSLISLADIIGSHDKETIRRAIITASHSAELAEKKQLILEELRFSESFINEHPALAENWRTSLNCFKDLANYFMANTLIDEHEEKAMCCWYLLLNHAIPEKIKTDDNSEITNDFPYEQMIILGKAYLSEPYQFAGFVGWLLTRGVSPHIIRESKLLHYYFDYYSYNFPTLDHTYRLLKNFSEIDTSSFLDYLATAPCLSKGFINNAPVIHEFFLMSELIPMPEERNILYVKKNNNVIEYSACGMKEIGKIEPDEFAEGFSELGKSQTFDRISVIAFERGQVNRAHAEYESYNVMGTLFAHKIAFLPPQADWLIGPETAFLEKNALILLPLFGFEFIKQLLSDTTEDSSSVISILLNSPYRDIILDALPLHSLSGELNYDQTERLLTQVGLVYSHYWEKEVGDDDGESYISQQLITAETRFINLIEFNFFYIHAYGLTYLPNDAIYQATVRLCENPNSKSVHHIPFLVSLSKKLKDENLLKTHEMLIHFIVEYLMELGDMLHDDYVVELDNIFEDNVLETIKVEFQAPFERKLAEYADNIDKAINDFLSGMGDIDAIEQIASAQLSAVNLIKCLTPELLCTIKYPHGYYQLRHEIIEKYFKKNEALLPLEDSIGNLLATMSDSIEIRIRILQEFLLLSKNTDHLRKIINYVMKQDGERIPYFFHATFGYKSCVYDFIVTHDDLEFKKWAFSIIPVSDSEMLDAIKRSLDNENRIAVLYLFQS